MNTRKSQRLAVLVDADNLEIFAEDTFHRRIDYAALWRAVNSRDIVRALYFKPRDCPARLRSFLEEHVGMEVRTPPKNVDSYLTMAGVTLAERVDTIALCSGDGDYVPLVEYLRWRGCRSEVWAFPGATALALRQAADAFHPLDESILLPATAKRSFVDHTSLPEVA